jgi:RNA polymerase sigma-70 factor (ECF subfamily)
MSLLQNQHDAVPPDRTGPEKPAPDSPGLSPENLLRSAFRYQDALVSYAYALLQDWALAQDAVQEAFIVLQRKHAEFNPGANVFAWVRQMVRFEALNIIRSRRREAYFVDEELFSLVDEQFERHLDQEATSAIESRKAALQHCMSRLDTESVSLLLGFYKDALSCEKLSELHRKSVNAVRLSLSRMRVKLRDCVRARLAIAEANS